MRFSQCAPLLLGTLASAVGALADTPGPSTTAAAADAESTSNIIAGAYIVELDDASPDAESLFKDLRADGLEVKPSMDLKFRLFNGVSFRVESPDSVGADALTAQIAAKGAVKALWPVRGIRFPQFDPANAGPHNLSASTQQQHQKRALGDGDVYTPHLMTQVDKLRAEGFTGKGLHIGVVDTGIDYRHPALGNGCFGREGCLVTKGWDYAGDEFDEGGNLKPDDDPIDTCQGHGTHVSGIVAAQENELGFTGAAPDVTLGVYKTSGCAGYATSEVLVAGIYRAYDEGADIISLSAGDDSGFSSDAAADAVSRLAAVGVPVIVATGNSGGLGLWNAASPASGREVGRHRLRREHQAADHHDEGVTSPTAPAPTASAGSRGTPSSRPMRRSDDQAANFVTKGGKHIIYYPESDARLAATYVYTEGIEGVFVVSPAQAAAWLKALGAGQRIDVSVSPVESARVWAEDLSNGPGAGLTSGFTSWGPSWEMVLKPQFTAPGGGILSTWTWGSGDYAVNPGTSMSAPLVAAIYGLVGQARKTLNAQVLRNVLSSTAKPLTWFDGETTHDGVLAPVAQQGAGLVQAYDAAHATTLVDTSGFSFNDTDSFTPKRTFTLENTAAEAVTYTFGHAKAATAYSFSADNLLTIARFPPPTADVWASIAFESETVTVPAGASAEVTFTLTPPAGLDAGRLPVYSGYITITPSTPSAGRLTLPYVGLAGSLHDFNPLHNQSVAHTGVYLSSTETHFLIPVAANRTFTIPRPGGTWAPPCCPSWSPSPRSAPQSCTSTSCPSTAAAATAQRHDQGLARLHDTRQPDCEISCNAPTIGYTHNFDAASPTAPPPSPDGPFRPEGAFQFVSNALRIHGDRDDKDDWVVVESVPFVLKYLSSKCKRVLLEADA
ncbi:subtilisin Carlsberg [Verticillium alfalfae VaMs.102]|uniref:Subtilisin Carlsberg n=1 Tax=Verticillium alfalfae (strain VaMs.102 / ATCC MYA-4576 / FGSC 10136) TaxID=526221 RepID=C9SCS0_VERA1|nr:subtilisin Carlsberg [Verticillium alfalfae VaMs.102]EEY16885.1 subtilisin Carlsberg [Verticillium alfalfae VaMs.102]